MGQSGNELETSIIKNAWKHPVVLYVIYEPERSLLWKWYGFESLEAAHNWIRMVAQIVHYVIWQSSTWNWDYTLELKHEVLEEWDIDDES